MVNPPGTKGAQSVASKMVLTTRDLVSPKGRIGRVTYLVNWLIYNLLFYALVLGATFAAGLFDEETAETWGWLLAPAAVIALALVYVLFCIHAKRLHDLGLTGFLCLLMFASPLLNAVLMLNGEAVLIPVDLVRWLDIFAKTTLGLSLVLQVVLLVWPGRHGDNGYGGNPKAA